MEEGVNLTMGDFLFYSSELLIYRAAMKIATLLVLSAFIPTSLLAQQGQDKDREIRLLKRQLEQFQTRQLTLNAALAASKKREFKARQEVKQLTTRLHALGLHEGDVGERLLQAVADAQALNKRLNELQEASEKTLFTFRQYLKQAQLRDVEVQKQLEVSLDQLETAIMGDNFQANGPKAANLNAAKILSIDAKSGMLVLNVGEKATAKIGMAFTIRRGNRVLGEAMIAEVRPNLSGALVVSLVNKEDPIRVGDTAQVKLQR